MIKNEDYINLLKKMVACVSVGDYCSVKELSQLQLDNVMNNNKKIHKNIKKLKGIKELKKCKEKPLKTWENTQLRKLLRIYSEYIINSIESSKDIGEIKKTILSIEEFIKII